MKISIDTKEDSYEDLQKIFHLLGSVLQQRGVAEPKSNEPVDTTNLMSMFGAGDSSAEKSGAGKAPDFSSFLNLAQEVPAKKEERMEIEYY